MPECESTKSCSKCGEVKPLEDFHVKKRATCGRTPRCKTCTAEDKLVYRGNQVVSDSTRARKEKKDYPDKVRARKNRWAHANREKKSAHMRVYLAIKSGLVLKPDTCSRCKTPGDLEGHHEDYSRPLTVEWLCRTCHARVHSGG